MPPKRARVKEEVQTNETMEDISEKGDQLEIVKEELARLQQDRDKWRKLFEDGNRRQEQEIARLKREHKGTLKTPHTNHTCETREGCPVQEPTSVVNAFHHPTGR